MPRDLDFTRRPVSRPQTTGPVITPGLTKPTYEPLPASILNRGRSGKKTKLSTWVWLGVVLLIVVWAVFFYYFSLKPSTVSQQPADKVSSTAAQSSSDVLLGAQASQNEPVQVTLYNSGAGADAVNALADKLKTINLTSEDLGDSQFQLDQTYIWYQAPYLTDVQKIQTLLVGKKVALRPYGGTGPYKILIQLGP